MLNEDLILDQRFSAAISQPGLRRSAEHHTFSSIVPGRRKLAGNFLPEVPVIQEYLSEGFKPTIPVVMPYWHGKEQDCELRQKAGDAWRGPATSNKGHPPCQIHNPFWVKPGGFNRILAERLCPITQRCEGWMPVGKREN
jgi:hypothetical protein